MANEATKAQIIIIDLSLRILHDAMDRADQVRVNTLAVRLALRCLLPHCPERWPLTNFWEAVAEGGEEPWEYVGRSQSCVGAFNGIVLQLKAAGRYPEQAKA